MQLAHDSPDFLEVHYWPSLVKHVVSAAPVDKLLASTLPSPERKQ